MAFLGSMDRNDLCENQLLASAGKDLLRPSKSSLSTYILDEATLDHPLESSKFSTATVPAMFKDILEPSSLSQTVPKLAGLSIENPWLGDRSLQLDRTSFKCPSFSLGQEASFAGSGFKFDPNIKFDSGIFSGLGSGLKFSSKLDQLELSTQSLLDKSVEVVEDVVEEEQEEMMVEEPFEAPKAKCPKYDVKIASPPVFKEDMASFASFGDDTKEGSDRASTLKTRFVNAVSGSLIRAPDFRSKTEELRQILIDLADEVAEHDPEFILKVTVYARQDLFIRTTANFLLAYAAFNSKVRPYLKRYFRKTVCTPADWIDVAEMYQVFDDSSINFGSLPAVLRRALAAKFPDFDAYQLGKYRSTGSGGKKRRKQKAQKKEEQKKSVKVDGGDSDKEKKAGVEEDPDAKSDEDEEDTEYGIEGKSLEVKGSALDNFGVPESDAPAVVPDKDDEEKDIERRTFTLKQLIRFLHVSQPAEFIMSLIGKKYPADEMAFRRLGLPGSFDSSRAGKRMKIPVPETWETQVALKGNKAKTWEDLIDRKKLPFLATVRNLRNLILAGISKTHHNKIVRTLTSEIAVTKSKLPAFRFFIAFAMLDELQKKLKEMEKDQQRSFEDQMKKKRILKRDPKAKEKKAQLREQWWKKKQKKLQVKKRQLNYNMELVDQYRKALDKAVLISTKQNVPPIPGKTLIFVSGLRSMLAVCQSAKGFGKPKNMLDVGMLLGLMALYVCEDAKLYASFGGSGKPMELKVQPGSLLENLERMLTSCLAQNTTKWGSGGVVPEELLKKLVSKREKIDNIMVLSNGDLMPPEMVDFLTQYRTFVNPDFLYVGVNLRASQALVPSFSDDDLGEKSDKNVLLAGFSEHLLRFLSERSSKSQLAHIERVDKKYELPPIPKPPLEDRAEDLAKNVSASNGSSSAGKTRGWRTVRVFISSPFRDMHGERDLLGRFVFPELREKARKLRINLVEVDLRWGVPEDDAHPNKSLEMCLTEVAKSDLFIGILGERYGEVVKSYEGAWDHPELEWLKNIEPGKSLTELEMEFAVLAHRRETYENKAFFFLRRSSALKSVPEVYRHHFETSDPESCQKLKTLKARIKKSGALVFQNYAAEFGGFVEDKPIMVGLEAFAQSVADTLWNALVRMHSEDVSRRDGLIQNQVDPFVGRKTALKDASSIITRLFRTGGILAVTGKPGLGKTVFMSELYSSMDLTRPRTAYVSHFADSLNENDSSTHGKDGVVSRIWEQIANHKECVGVFLEDEIDPRDLLLNSTTAVLRRKLPGYLAALSKAGRRLVIFLDGLDNVYGEGSGDGDGLDWMPAKLPEGIVVVLSMSQGSKFSAQFLNDGPTGSLAAARRPQGIITLGPLLVNERVELIKNLLAKYGKTLEEASAASQMKALVAKKDAGNPVYLRLAVEEIRIFGVFEKLDDKLRKLGSTIEALFEEIVRRLEAEYGVNLVQTILRLLLVAKDGLLEEEIIDLAALASAYNLQLKETGSWLQMENISDVYQNSGGAVRGFGMVSRLLREVKHWLAPRAAFNADGGSVFALKDKVLNAVARAKVFGTKGGEKHEVLSREILADYYLMKCWDYNLGAVAVDASHRDLSKVVYHLCLAGRFRLLADFFLCNLEYVEKKAALGLLESLLQDYTLIQSNALDSLLMNKRKASERQDVCQSREFQEFRNFVSNHLHTLKKAPCLTIQCALNEFPGSSVRFAAERALDRDQQGNVAVTEWCNRPKRRRDPCEMVLSEFRGPLMSCATSLDGKLVAVGSEDGVISLHDLETTKEQGTLVGHGTAVASLCFVGMDRLCSGSEDGQLCVWDIDRQYRIHSVQGHARKLAAIAVSPDFMSFVSVGWDCKIKIWNSNDCREISCITHPLLPVSCICHHPERNVIITGGWDATIRIWDTVTLKRIAILRGHGGSVRGVAISACGRMLASASVDGTVKLWSSSLGVEIGTFRANGAGPVNAVAFSADGKSVVSAGIDGRLVVWPTNSCRNVKHYPLPVSQTVAIIEPNPSLTSAAVGFRDGTIKVYDFDGAGRHSRLSTRLGAAAVAGACFMDDNTVAAFCESSNLVHLMKVPGARNCNETAEMPAAISSLGKIEGNFLGVGCEDGFLRIINAGSLDSSGETLATRIVCAIYHGDGPVGIVTTSSNGDYIATASGSDNEVKIWKNPLRKANVERNSDDSPVDHPDSSDDGPHAVLSNLHAGAVKCATWGRAFDKDFLVTGSSDATVVIYSLEKNKVAFRLTGHATAISFVKAQESYVISCSTDGQIILWSLTGARIADFTTAAYSQPGFGLLVKRKSQEKDMDWAEEVEAEEKEKDDAGKSGRKRAMEDVEVANAVLVVSGFSGIDVLQLFQGKEDAILTGHQGAITGLTVLPGSSSKFVTTGVDKTVRVWNIDASQDEDMTTEEGCQMDTDGVASTNHTCSPHESAITQMVLFDAFNLVVTTDRDGKVVLWDTRGLRTSESWEPVQVEKEHSMAISAIAKVSGVASKKLVTGCLGGKICVWTIKKSSGRAGLSQIGENVEDRLLKACKPVWEHHVPVSALAFDPRQKLLFVAFGSFFKIMVYSLETMTQRGAVNVPFTGPSPSASGFQLRLTDDRLLLCDNQVLREIQWRKSVVKKSSKKSAPSTVHAFLHLSFGASYPVPLNGSIPCGFLAGIGNSETVWIGDSRGVLHETFLPKESDHRVGQIDDLSWKQKKLHNAPINTLIPLNVAGAWFLVSVADEPYLKIWQGCNIEALLQVGQFECPAILSCAMVTEVSGEDGTICLVCTDVWGASHDFKIKLPVAATDGFSYQHDIPHSLNEQYGIGGSIPDGANDGSDDDEGDSEEDDKKALIAEDDDMEDDDPVIAALFD